MCLDEVESLTAARKSTMSGAEPSDAIRVVNALLTQIDQLKNKSNVIILTTSNITGAIGKVKVSYLEKFSLFDIRFGIC